MCIAIRPWILLCKLVHKIYKILVFADCLIFVPLAPIYQFGHYYRHGELDENCTSYINDFFRCVYLRNKFWDQSKRKVLRKFSSLIGLLKKSV